MVPVLSLLSFALFITFIIALFIPKKLIKKENPKRLMALVYYLIPAIGVFSISAMLDNKNKEEEWQNPKGVKELRLYGKEFIELPERIKEFKDAESISIENGKLESLNQEILSSLPLLRKLDLSDNPLSEAPEWLASLNLEELDLSGTNIEVIPAILFEKIKKIDYEDTPLEEKEIAQAKAKEEKKLQKQKALEDSLYAPKGESFGQFSLRKLLGKDYGYSKNFKKGELYYDKSITDAQVDSLGNYMIEKGFFNNDRANAMQITYNDKPEVKAYELKAVYNGVGQPTEDIEMVFKLQAIFVSMQIFKGKPVHFILTDNQFKPLYTYKSED